LVRAQDGQPNREENMTEQKIEIPQETWAGATKEFFRQLGGVLTLLIIVMSVGQCSGCFDIYRLLGK
jgi:hypothetical protein